MKEISLSFARCNLMYHQTIPKLEEVFERQPCRHKCLVISSTISIEDFKCLKSSVFAVLLSVVEDSRFEIDLGVGESSNCITFFRDMLRFFSITNSLANVSCSDLMATSFFFTLVFAGADLLSNIRIRNFNYFVGS